MGSCYSIKSAMVLDSISCVHSFPMPGSPSQIPLVTNPYWSISSAVGTLVMNAEGSSLAHRSVYDFPADIVWKASPIHTHTLNSACLDR